MPPAEPAADPNAEPAADPNAEPAADPNAAPAADPNAAPGTTVLTGGEPNSEGAAAAGSEEEGSEEGSQTAPESYAEFTLPEGMSIDQAALDQYTPVLKELGLNQEQAQALVNIRAKELQELAQGQDDAFDKQLKDWLTESNSDKEFGGDKFEESVKVAGRAISAYGTPELKTLMNEYGIGNHPEVIRFMYRVGLKLPEDVPGGEGSNTGGQQDTVSLLYPNARKD